MVEKSDKEQRGGFVLDARGRRVPQLDPFLLRLTRRFDVMPREDLEVIAGKIGTGLTIGRWIALACLLCALLLWTGWIGVVLFDLSQGRRLSLGEFLKGMGNFVLPSSIIAGLWIGACRLRCKKTVRVMLAHRRCPHCGYDLRGLPPDSSDGATVCPECSCAWRLPTVIIADGRSRS